MYIYNVLFTGNITSSNEEIRWKKCVLFMTNNGTKQLIYSVSGHYNPQIITISATRHRNNIYYT